MSISAFNPSIRPIGGGLGFGQSPIGKPRKEGDTISILSRSLDGRPIVQFRIVAIGTRTVTLEDPSGHQISLKPRRRGEVHTDNELLLQPYGIVPTEGLAPKLVLGDILIDEETAYFNLHADRRYELPKREPRF